MKPKIFAILEPDEKMSMAQLNSAYHETIDILSSHHNTHFIISDTFTFAQKYLAERGFRNCTLYHLGDVPIRNLGRFKTKGGFNSRIEILEALKQNCDEIVKR